MPCELMRSCELAEREKDAPGDGGADAAVPPKRPRINRNRYPTQAPPHAIARKLLPIDHQAGERVGRKD
ncbi:hypothetical protein EVG20_g10823 [Dentipellis fragilis]|uniref:Uncharacterized protein n=1 Tax=Dentipellis fragilis TaxID=205917 RepID=A0A4Y9XPX2_9AGAM|nr:hypothetical protein EVG20_g10823 [Dentipellis fragilis]